MNLRRFLGLDRSPSESSQASAKRGEVEEVVADRLLRAYLDIATTSPEELLADVTNSQEGRTILASCAETRYAILSLCIGQIEGRFGSGYISPDEQARLQVATALARGLIEFEEKLPSDLVWQILTAMARSRSSTWLDRSGLFNAIFLTVIVHVERHLVEGRLPDPLKHRAESLFSGRSGNTSDPASRNEFARVNALLRASPSAEDPPLDRWAANVLKATQASKEESERCRRILAHAGKAYAAPPSLEWRSGAGGIQDEYGREWCVQRVRRWLHEHRPRGLSDISDRTSPALRGLAAWCAVLDDPSLCPILGVIAEASYRKIPKMATRSVLAGNACVWALERMTGEEAISQLARLALSARHPEGNLYVRRALWRRAALAGVTYHEIPERFVPVLDIPRDGRMEVDLGGITGEALVAGARVSPVAWSDEGGKAIKTLPAAVRREHAPRIEEFEDECADVASALKTQRDRLDRSLRVSRAWSAGEWRSRCLDHPVLWHIARTLIWEVDTPSGPQTVLPAADTLQSVGGQVVPWPDGPAQVRLWSPVGRPVPEVVAWRERIESLGVTQAVKQAHREVYLLTDAERSTGAYSNRMAAHILRHYQLASLCSERGWDYVLPRFSDAGRPTSATYLDRETGARAEFCLQAAENAEMSDGGVALYVTTDRIQFLDRDGRPLHLESIPERVFSEIMRDTDLFVGVTSVGNDPEWQNGGPNRVFRDYWQRYATCDLAGAALDRKENLSRVIPKLRIADRCSIQANHLVVRGQLHTYRIHIGSGHIFIASNNQYVCIVPDRKDRGIQSERIFLPFDGDTALSLILSKAFLLADDSKIKDPVITRQIRN